MTVPASFKTLVYSPTVRIVIESTDVSSDIVRGSVNRITGGASSLEFTLSNKGGRYDNRFRRMDRVVVFMKRINELQVFSGYLDLVPGLQLYPSTVTFRASCTIKRILYMYWDPYLAKSARLMNRQVIPFGSGSPTATVGDTDTALTDPAPTTAVPGVPDMGPPGGMTAEEWNKLIYPQLAPGTAPATGTSGSSTDPNVAQDSGLGNMLKQLLNKVGGWEMDQLLVQTFPESFLGYIEDNKADLKTYTESARDAFKKLFQYDESTAATTAGGGNLGDAVFTSIGPPANGDAYSNEEIVWIVTNAGWAGEDVVIGSSIIKAESGGRPGVTSPPNSDGTLDKGLWQINTVHDDMLPGQNRLDPAVSTNIARTLYKNRGNWDDWSTLVYHHTAQQHFDTFRPLVASGGTMPPGSKVNGASSSGSPAPGSVVSSNGQTPTAPGSTPLKTDPVSAAAPLGSYGLPSDIGTTGPDGMEQWSRDLGASFGVSPSTYAGHQTSDRTSEGFYPNPQHLNRGIDWSGSVDDMQKFADHLMQVAPTTPSLEMVIWQNPGTGAKSGWFVNRPDSDGAIYADYYPEHQNHVHTRHSAAMGPGGGGGGGTGTGGTGTSGSDQLAKNIFTYQFLQDSPAFGEAASYLFRGRYSSLNDEPLFKSVKAICDAGMREFMSAPNGDFIAFYPDYFGIDNTATILKLEDVEMKNVSISINDDALTTHVFTMGSMDAQGMMTSVDGVSGYLLSPGTVTVEDEWLFKRVTEGSFFQSDAADAKELLSRFGVRPTYRSYPNIYQVEAPEVMLLVAIKVFMQKWAEQYQSSVSFTFMPELYPGMRIELVGHDLVVYVKSVTHNFDYEQGFSTSAQVMAPMSVSRAPFKRVGDVPISESAKDVADVVGGFF